MSSNNSMMKDIATEVMTKLLHECDAFREELDETLCVEKLYEEIMLKLSSTFCDDNSEEGRANNIDMIFYAESYKEYKVTKTIELNTSDNHFWSMIDENKAKEVGSKLSYILTHFSPNFITIKRVLVNLFVSNLTNKKYSVELTIEVKIYDNRDEEEHE